MQKVLYFYNTTFMNDKAVTYRRTGEYQHRYLIILHVQWTVVNYIHTTNYLPGGVSLVNPISATLLRAA